MPYNSVQYPLKLAVKARLDALLLATSLPTLTSATPVLVRSAPWFGDFGLTAQNKTYTWPGIVVSNAQGETNVPVTNNSQDIGFVVLITIALQLEDANVADLLENTAEDNRLAWRDVIIDNFVPKGVVAASPERKFHKADYMGGTIVDWNELSTNKRWVSSMLIRFWTRKQHV